MIAISCKTSEKEALWEPDVYQVVPGDAHLLRSKGDEKDEIKCSDKRAANYLCIAHDDMERLFQHCLKAEK